MHKYVWQLLLAPSAAALLFGLISFPASAEPLQTKADRSLGNDSLAKQFGQLAPAALGLTSNDESLQGRAQTNGDSASSSVAIAQTPFVTQTSLETNSATANAAASPIPTESIPTLDVVEDVSESAAGLSGTGMVDSLGQVTAVTQLSDVSPADWAYEALSRLIENYGCIAGYPDGTYRGSRAMTRYEFAAGLNACLDALAERLGDGISEEDLDALRRLTDEFRNELASLRGRVDTLEGRVTDLEENQFSTTTVLRGQTFFNLTGAFAGDDIRAETSSLTTPLNLRPAARDPITGRPVISTITDDPNITFSYLIWLNLNTSFNGKDSLFTQLTMGNGDSPANVFASAGLYNTFGVPFVDQTGGVEANSVYVRELFYSFPVGDQLQVVVGPRINWYRYFDNNRFTFFLNGAGSFNSSGGTQLNAIDRGSGAVVLWRPSSQFRLGLGYLGENSEFLPASLFNSSSDPSQGLFNGTNTITAELTYSPIRTLNLRFLYTRSRIDAIFGRVGGAIGEPIYGLADDGSAATLDHATADTFSANFDWLVTPTIGTFARYAYANTDLGVGDVKAQSFQAGVAFLDLLKQGSQFTLSYLIPFSVLDGEEFLVSGGGDGGVQYEFEATYYYPLTDNISLVPSFYLIGNANNFSDNPNIYVGNLRMQFSF